MKSCTDLEQSKKLLELGIDVNSADLLYSGVHLGSDSKYYKSDDNWVMTPEYFIQLPHNCESDIKNQLPAWSLVALLKLFPNGVWYNNYYGSVILLPQIKNNWICRLYNPGYDINVAFIKNEPLDAAYEMVVWLKENEKL